MKLSSQTLEVTLQQEEFIIYVYTEENYFTIEVDLWEMDVHT